MLTIKTESVVNSLTLVIAYTINVTNLTWSLPVIPNYGTFIARCYARAPVSSRPAFESNFNVSKISKRYQGLIPIQPIRRE